MDKKGALYGQLGFKVTFKYCEDFQIASNFGVKNFIVRNDPKITYFDV
jgi:hypothetical protein